MPTRSRKAFTLVELLTVIGIIAVLIGILLPTVAAVRESAERVRCAATLRELAALSTMRLNADRSYPAAPLMPAAGAYMPASVQATLLEPYTTMLHKPPVEITDTVDRFPHPLVCPVRRTREINQSADTSLGTPFWVTGYMYVAGLERTPNAGERLKPARGVDARGTRRGVLWADLLTVSTYGGMVTGYGFYHAGNRWEFDPTTRTSRTRAALRGQHLGWSDGSVEWVRGSAIALGDVSAAASYRVSIGGVYGVHYVY